MNTFLLAIITLIIGYLLGKNRDNEKIIFDKKLEIYSNINYHLNSSKDFELNLDIFEDKLTDFTNNVCNEDFLSLNKLSTDHITAEIEEVNIKIKSLKYKNNLIKLFSPARLIGSQDVVDELRNYFSLISEYYLISKKEDVVDIIKKISKSVMELEQLMRRDLGRYRIYSKSDIDGHIEK